MTTGNKIPRDVALKLCDEIRSENRQKRFPIREIGCFFCYKYAKGDVGKMCISSEQGCSLVNKRYKFQKTDK